MSRVRDPGVTEVCDVEETEREERRTQLGRILNVSLAQVRAQTSLAVLGERCLLFEHSAHESEKRKEKRSKEAWNMQCNVRAKKSEGAIKLGFEVGGCHTSDEALLASCGAGRREEMSKRNRRAKRKRRTNQNNDRIQFMSACRSFGLEVSFFPQLTLRYRGLPVWPSGARS